jgi:hypothetical protein
MGSRIFHKNLTVEMPDQDRDKLFAVAEMRGTSVSELVRSWVDEKLQKMGHTIAEEI